MAYQQLAGGRHAVATHVGHYSTLNQVYPRLMKRITRMKGVRPAGLPAIEMYHETKINVAFSLNHTDIYLPVIAQGSRALGTPSAASATDAADTADASSRAEHDAWP